MIKSFTFYCATSLFLLFHQYIYANPNTCQTKLIANKSSVKAGSTFFIGLKMTLLKGWHNYWVNPGDSGMETSIEWHLPKGISAGKIQWPYPERHDLAGIIAFAYANEVILITKMTCDKNFTGPINISADVSWLTCKENCIPGAAKLDIALQSGSNKENPKHSIQINKYLKRVPAKKNSWIVEHKQNTIILINVEKHFEDIKHIEFFPMDTEEIDVSNKIKYAINAQVLSVTLKIKTKLKHINGVLVVHQKSGSKAFDINQKLKTKRTVK
ncbi:MAG: hypothetical protein HRT88_06340 [Lentisphaeraceae bacterium]|nr:hypothetical protein [Lentisphaeraceae bacterium]